MTRIQALHRGPLKEDRINLSLGSIYQISDLVNIDYIPSPTPETHTMYEALDEYVMQKLPVGQILETAKFGGRLEVHGIYPKHFEFVFERELTDGTLCEIDFYHRPTARKYNVVRPRFFVHKSHKKFIMCVVPGSDYIKHYGTMIRRIVERFGIHADLKLIYYPIAFHALPFWTHLHKGFVEEGDRVIIGYVDEVFTEINSTVNLLPVTSANNPYLESRRYRLPSGSIVNFLGVNFSFWGNLSQIIVESACRSGAREVIWFGEVINK